ncbi:MAG: hypothetical protein R2854_00375 [Caldilineaceae bacterium]
MPDVDTMRQMTDLRQARCHRASAVVDEKPMLVASVTQDLIDRGLHATWRDAAKLMGGGGGGRPNMA